MLLRLPFLRLIAALLLGIVGLQAGVPTAAPLHVAHGSAFSADTHEVALVVQRRGEQARPALAPQPLLTTSAPAPVTQSAGSEPVLPAPRPHSTAPPARDLIAQRPSPRGPPLA